MASKVVDIDALSTAERLDLLEQLWDSLSGNPTCQSSHRGTARGVGSSGCRTGGRHPPGAPAWHSMGSGAEGDQGPYLKPPIFRPLAAADVEEAYRWYDGRRQGLGDEFLAAVQGACKAQSPVRMPIRRYTATSGESCFAASPHLPPHRRAGSGLGLSPWTATPACHAKAGVMANDPAV